MEEEKEKDIEEQLKECKKLRDEYLAGWQRARADLLNYKKEEMARVGDILKYASEGLILKMLPIIDNFDVALKNLPDKGFLQIKEQILSFLKEQGVEEIKSVGKKFDPNFHEVVAEVDTSSSPLANAPEVDREVEEQETRNKEQGIILEETQKGYTINGRLLRPARVKVSK